MSFSYKPNSTETISGAFHIYQARNGGIYLTMAGNATRLSYAQVKSLQIDVHHLEDFDLDDYKFHYQEERDNA